jgi:hypothetical protein
VQADEIRVKKAKKFPSATAGFLCKSASPVNQINLY